MVVTTRDGIVAIPLQEEVEPPPVAAALDRGTYLSTAARSPAEVTRVQRAVLAYLELSPSRIARLEQRSRQAAWLPQMRATLSLDRASSRDRDYDEVFSSGSVRDLLDSGSDSDRGASLDLQLTWDLARLASPDDALAISRERRLLIELRDQVLERVNRLWFERERVFAKLAASRSATEPERGELELRARELTAQLDGWTGGTLSRLERTAWNSPTDTRRNR